jgi:hypothetical protein
MSRSEVDAATRNSKKDSGRVGPELTGNAIEMKGPHGCFASVPAELDAEDLNL